MIRAWFVVSPPDPSAATSHPNDPPLVSIWLNGHVFLPKFKTGGPVRFIVDTGAEGTTLDIPDAKLLIPRRSLFDGHRMSEPRPADGIGGSEWYYPEEAHIVFFHDDGKPDILEQTIDIPVATQENWERSLGSLLGMDVLSRYRVSIDFSKQIATLKYPTGNQPGPPVGPESITG